MKVLIPNIGSTSFKYRLLDMPGEAILAQGRVERIGQPGSECPDYPAAIRKCIDSIVGPGKPLASLNEIEAVGFKAVHAGPFNAPQTVDQDFLDGMREFIFMAPAHNPPYIAAMEAFASVLPGVPLVAVVEPFTWRHMEEASTTYAVPYEWRTQYGIRRYGFHGASHRAASENILLALGVQKLRHISCHLGGSSSIGAFRDGVGIDVSMGCSPQSGLPQNNRVGDIDVFAVLHMMKKLGLDPDQMATLLGSKSGLAGVSGTSGDMRDLTEAAAAGSQPARLALDMFVHFIRHYVGAFLYELGGVDAITFSGGIGENSSEVRSAVLANLAELGILLDEEMTASLKAGGEISAPGARGRVFVVPANEELIVARETVAVVQRAAALQH